MQTDDFSPWMVDLTFLNVNTLLFLFFFKRFRQALLASFVQDTELEILYYIFVRNINSRIFALKVTDYIAIVRGFASSLSLSLSERIKGSRTRRVPRGGCRAAGKCDAWADIFLFFSFYRAEIGISNRCTRTRSLLYVKVVALQTYATGRRQPVNPIAEIRPGGRPPGIHRQWFLSLSLPLSFSFSQSSHSTSGSSQTAATSSVSCPC